MQTEDTAPAMPRPERRRAPASGEQPKLHLQFAPPLTQEMRDHIAKLRDEAFADGRAEGRADVEREYYGNGVISLGFGVLVGAGALALIQRIFERIFA